MNHRGNYLYRTDKYGKYRVKIDKDISHMISLMWKLGIDTSNSCQAACAYDCKCRYKNGGNEKKRAGCNNHVWIAFPSSRELEKFMNIVAKFEPTNDKHEWTMYDHVQGYGRPCGEPSWLFSFAMSNHGEKKVIKKGYFDKPTVHGHLEGTKAKKQKSFGYFDTVGCGRNNFRVEPQLHFQRQYLEYVVKRLEEAVYVRNLGS